MPRSTGGYSDRPVPILETGETTRLDYWWKFSRPLPRELLEITGWISADPARPVMTQTGAGPVAMRAAEAPNVLFRVPETGAGRRQWESVLHYLRLVQRTQHEVATKGLLHGDAEKEAAEELRKADEALAAAEAESRTAQASVGEAREAARHYIEQLQRRKKKWRERPKPQQLARARELVDRVHELEAAAGAPGTVAQLVADRRAAAERLERARALVQRDAGHRESTFYPGLHAEINAFLDLQALTAATVASREFQRRDWRAIEGRADELGVALDREED